MKFLTPVIRCVHEKTGTVHYQKKGKRAKSRCYHRDFGPAITTADAKYWYRDGKLHRIFGPAVVRNDGTRYWCRYGKLHRRFGPARIDRGVKQRWNNGILIK